MSGPSKHRSCKFPFEHKGKIYNSCTAEGLPPGVRRVRINQFIKNHSDGNKIETNWLLTISFHEQYNLHIFLMNWLELCTGSVVPYRSWWNWKSKSRDRWCLEKFNKKKTYRCIFHIIIFTFQAILWNPNMATADVPAALIELRKLVQNQLSLICEQNSLWYMYFIKYYLTHI